MIEEKETGAVIAENSIEALWFQTKKSSEQRIKAMENSLIIERAFVTMCEEQLKNIPK